MKAPIQNTLKILLILAVVAFISFLFPQHQPFSTEYRVGEIWKDEILVSPFDFPIQKGEDEIGAEKAAIRAEFYPYFRMDPGVEDKVTQGFVKQLQSFIKTEDSLSLAISESLIHFGSGIIDDVYEVGVIDTIPDTWPSLYVEAVRDKTTQTRSVSSFLTQQQAKEKVRTSLVESDIEDKSTLLTLISNLIVPNYSFDEELTEKFLDQAYSSVSAAKGKIGQGEVILSKGEVITQDKLTILESLKTSYNEQIGGEQKRWFTFSGYGLLTMLLIGVLILYIILHYKEIYSKFSSLAFILIWAVLYSYMVYAIEQTDNISTYIIPFCIIPIVIKNFYDDSLALYVHLVIVLIASFLSNLGYEFTFLQLLAGIVAVLFVKETRFWNQFFQSIFFIILTYVLGYLGLSLISIGNLNEIDYSMIIWFLLTGILTLLAYPLIPLMERIFGYTSSITLAELNDLNHPLLRNLSVKAPGTLQHSLQVANLSEAAAEEIGANSLLVRVGSLYHDIGKMNAPEFFIENQSKTNPHELIDDKESAEIIIKHVSDGIKMAAKQKLPRLITDFIRTHHGDSRTEYFYRTYVQKHPDELIDDKAFRYPGPKPTTREQAIVMLADSVEAASKSLNAPTGKDIDDLVDKIGKDKIAHGQLDNSNLSFAEFKTCLAIFKQLLRSINHVRIEYPPEVKSSDSTNDSSSSEQKVDQSKKGDVE